MVPGALKSNSLFPNSYPEMSSLPVIISTWSHGIDANTAANEVLENGGSVVDAVETAVKIPEADPNNRSVGLGGIPDRDGHVTLDASIMGPDGNAGSVCFLESLSLIHISEPTRPY